MQSSYSGGALVILYMAYNTQQFMVPYILTAAQSHPDTAELGS